MTQQLNGMVLQWGIVLECYVQLIFVHSCLSTVKGRTTVTATVEWDDGSRGDFIVSDYSASTPQLLVCVVSITWLNYSACTPGSMLCSISGFTVLPYSSFHQFTHTHSMGSTGQKAWGWSLRTQHIS